MNRKVKAILLTLCLLCGFSCHKGDVNSEDQHELIVTKSEGIAGFPESGTFIYNHGDIVNYEYYLQSGYDTLIVTLDGLLIPDGGTFYMNTTRKLVVTASIQNPKLTVIKGEGVKGSPSSGIYSYKLNDIVNYYYNLKNGYTNLVVKIDGNQVPNSGNFSMDNNRQLIAEASKPTPGLTLSVIPYKSFYSGYPKSGTYHYNRGDKVNFNYSNNYMRFWVIMDFSNGAQETWGSNTTGPPYTCSGSFFMIDNGELGIVD